MIWSIKIGEKMLRLVSELFDFDLHFFDLVNDKKIIINCDVSFCDKVNMFVYENSVRDYASTVGKFYFESLGYKVIENYANKQRKGYWDLTVIKKSEELFIEMKLYKDKVSFLQLSELVENKGNIVFVVPKKKLDNEELLY
jgi:hypothetical protein